MAEQKGADAPMRDDGDIALGRGEGYGPLDGSDDPALRINRPFPSANTFFRPREELVRDGLELDPWQVTGRRPIDRTPASQGRSTARRIRRIPTAESGQSGTGTSGSTTTSGCVMKWTLAMVFRTALCPDIRVIASRPCGVAIQGPPGRGLPP